MLKKDGFQTILVLLSCILLLKWSYDVVGEKNSYEIALFLFSSRLN